jgi:hypothetical protein
MKNMSTKINRFLLATVCAVGLAGMSNASAATSTMSFQPNPTDLNDLDHHLVVTWRIDNINLSNVSITGASLTFTNIANWDNNTNRLFVYLLDTAIGSGVNTFQDVNDAQVPVVDISDAFLGSLPSLITSSTAKTKLFDKSFTTTASTYTYNFTAAQLLALQTYIANGHDIAFGFDPDCHYFNDGIKFTMTLTPVPEMASAIPALCLVALATAFEIRRRRRANA